MFNMMIQMGHPNKQLFSWRIPMVNTWNPTFKRQPKNIQLSGIVNKDGTLDFRDPKTPVSQFMMEKRATK